MPFKDFTVGQILTSTEVDEYLMRQAVMVFAGTAERGTALGTAILTEGMVTYQQDTNTITVYDGTAWQTVYPAEGDITAVTAGTGLTGGGSSGAVTLNVDYGAVGSAVTISAGQVTTSVATIGSAVTAYTAVAGDANNVIYSVATAAATAIIHDIFDIGDRIDIWRDGAGTVVIASGTGVTSWAGAGTAATGTAITLTFKIDQQYNAATVQKVAANTYRVVGKITA